MKNHNMKDCRFNQKGKNPSSAKPDERKKEEAKRPDYRDKSGTKKIRSAEKDSDSSDSEQEAPRALSSKNINSAERKMPYILEISDDDEPSVAPPWSDKRMGRKKAVREQDFYPSTM